MARYSAQTDNLTEKLTKVNEDKFSCGDLQDIPVNKNYKNGSGEGLTANYNENQPEGYQESIEKHPEDESKPLYVSKYEVLFDGKFDDKVSSEYKNNFKYLGLSAEFKTALSGFLPISGSYGLLIVIQYSQLTESPMDRTDKYKLCKLDSTSMIGNVYNFNSWYKQEALFQIDNDVSKGTTIDRITVLFYQDGEFRSYDNTLIPVVRLGDDVIKNLFVRNLDIRLGDDIPSDVEDEASLNTNNGLFYDSAQKNDKINEKTIKLKWLHRNPVQDILDNGEKTWV